MTAPRTGAGSGNILRALIASVIWVALSAADLRGQLPEVSAYYFNLGSGSGESPVSDAGASSFQRLRIMSSPGVGSLTLDVAYEHTLLLQSSDVLGTGGVALVPEASGNWLALNWDGGRGGALLLAASLRPSRLGRSPGWCHRTVHRPAGRFMGEHAHPHARGSLHPVRSGGSVPGIPRRCGCRPAAGLSGSVQ